MEKQSASPAQDKSLRKRLVQTAAAKLRAIILEREPGGYIGSLTEVCALLGVGIVTVQQAARILEHEGLLTVRRGPGGGYYGARPDEAALERALATFMRVHNSSFEEARELTTLLDCELATAAARCCDEHLRDEMRDMEQRIATCDTAHLRIAFEQDLRRLFFRMDSRPLFELISRVTTQLHDASTAEPLYPGEQGVAAWKLEKRRIVEAILKQDAELARFEAKRHREELLARSRLRTRARRVRGEIVDGLQD